MIFFTSDTHFGHSKIIEYCNRPFSSIEAMDEILIENWNKIITKKDTVYHLGDFAFRNTDKYIKRLNGQIHLILGHHDRNKKGQEYFKSLSQIKILKSVIPKIILCHYAMRTWPYSHDGAWHLYGHSHGRMKEEGLSFDVGVDCWSFAPISYDLVKNKMEFLKSIIESS